MICVRGVWSPSIVNNRIGRDENENREKACSDDPGVATAGPKAGAREEAVTGLKAAGLGLEEVGAPTLSLVVIVSWWWIPARLDSGARVG